ncbi:MAG: hypothetical protein K5665_11690 [Saccharofermentans sp.]|nr:hypothetical protein [Saccharofermentans sp.]
MKKRFNMACFISAAITAATVFSFGSLAMADEVETAEATDNTDVIDEIQDEELIISGSSEETAAVEADYAHADGWDEYSVGYWRYYENGSYVKGWKQIKGKWYWFNNGGTMFTGMRYDADYGACFIFGIDGAMITDRWQRYDNSWYYLDKNGRAATGWKQIDGKWYYFNLKEASDPYMYRNTLWNSEGNIWYLFSGTGEMLTGWQMYNEEWYYIDPATGQAAVGWKEFKGKWYYFLENSGSYPRMICNTLRHITNSDGGSAWYGFDENGALRSSGWYNDYVVEYKDETIYAGNWYCFDSNGKALTGWKQLKGKWFYFGDGINDPYARQGLNQIDGKYYYFDNESCAMSTGWIDPNAYYEEYYAESSRHRWMYFGSDGVAYSGWKSIDGKTYYFDENNSNGPFMTTNFIRVKDVRYFMGDSGVLRKGGWFRYDENYYYANSDGSVVESDWKTIGGKTYYFNYGGAMVTGMRKIEGHIYDFGDNGVCINPPASVG